MRHSALVKDGMYCIGVIPDIIILVPHLFNSKSQQLIWGSETCRFISTAPDLQMGARILSGIRGQETTWPNTHSVCGLSTYIVTWGQSIVIILTTHGGHVVSNLRLLDCLANSLFSMILKKHSSELLSLCDGNLPVTSKAERALVVTSSYFNA